MLKLLGAAVICFVCAAGGLYYAAKIRKAQRCRGELRRLIELIETNIKNGALPLARIYEQYHTPTLTRCGFRSVLLSEGFEAALPAVVPILDDESAGILAEFASSVGKSAHAAAETALCARTLASLDTVERTRRPKEDTRAALFARLGLIAAIAAALVLL